MRARGSAVVVLVAALATAGLVAVVGAPAASADTVVTDFPFVAGAPGQPYVVPDDISALAIEVWAGDGGDGAPDPTFFGTGAPGVHVVGVIGVAPGDALTIVVGGAGGDGVGSTVGAGGAGRVNGGPGGPGGGGGSSLLQLQSVTAVDSGVVPSPSGTGDGFVRLTATTGCGGGPDAEPADALQVDPRFTG